MASISAGLLMCRWNKELEYFLVHPGGPFFKNKNDGFWTIPKGLQNDNEDLLETAKREFEEETGIKAIAPLYTIGSIKQKSGKLVYAWTFLGEWNDQAPIKCNTFEIEWPPKSGKLNTFPEVDKAAWMTFEIATQKIIKAQLPFLELAKSVHQRP